MTGSYELFRDVLLEEASIFKKNLAKVEGEFGSAWRSDFDAHLGRLFGTDRAAYRRAVRGYRGFAVDVMRLQHRFNATQRYEPQTYSEVCNRVYLNEEYMIEEYLPGILVSHFLWRHHYQHVLFYREHFVPLLRQRGIERFYDVGTGTGFYSLQLLRSDERVTGTGIDISPSSRAFTRRQLEKWNCLDRFESSSADVSRIELEPRPCVQSIEVLEHLTDPEEFLRRLRKLLSPGGVGFITAALTAAERDHIYLYWEAADVARQLERAGFSIRETNEQAAYEGGPGEIVPRVVAFVVS